jgi:hypothetical protein
VQFPLEFLIPKEEGLALLLGAASFGIIIERRSTVPVAAVLRGGEGHRRLDTFGTEALFRYQPKMGSKEFQSMMDDR